MNKRIQKYVAVVVLSGCAVRTNARVPAVQMPSSYSAGAQGSSVQNTTADLASWWKTFQDPTLNSLVDRAVKGNIDLRIAQERVRKARAVRGYTSATRQLPNTGITGGYSDRSGPSRTGSNFISTGNNSSLYQTGFDASYEIDLFGGARASVKAAEADAQATEEAMRNTLVSVVAETGRNYMDLREAQERLSVAQNNLKAQDETLRLTNLRQSAGLVSELDTNRAKAQAETTRAAIPLLQAQAQRSIHAIALLLGQQPQAVQAELSVPGVMPPAPPEVPLGLPSELLRRRPDVRQAERRIAGDAARVGVAVSNLYPKFSLTGSGGGQSGALLNILSGAARLWSFGTSFSWGLLNYPATKANIEAAKSRERQTSANYEKTVLTALRDVEDSLATYTKDKERQPALMQAVDANRKALELAKLRYDKGLSNFLDVLDAQRSLYAAANALTQNRASVDTDLVALYKALGGGW